MRIKRNPLASKSPSVLHRKGYALAIKTQDMFHTATFPIYTSLTAYIGSQSEEAFFEDFF